MADEAALTIAAGLPCWSGPVAPEPLGGGLSNTNFVVRDRGRRYVARIGADVPVHGVMRFNELNASRAAHAAGLAPEVAHWQPNALVIAHVEGRTLTPAAMRAPAMLARVAEVISRCHRDVAPHLRGPVLMFWPFHLARHYASLLRDGDSRHRAGLARLLDISARLERAIGPIAPVFGHNDLLAANFIDDGTRLWLIDWEHSGFSSPLFDLANLASNNELDRAAEEALLVAYLGHAPDAAFIGRFDAMTCVSLLREAMWGMVSELHSPVAYDFGQYADQHLARFERAWSRFQGDWGIP
jgi:thiamine kinase-like enzyme